LYGIVLTGKAGVTKDKELSDKEKNETIIEFNFKKGIIVALFAGILSASFAFGIAAGSPISEKALEWGADSLFSNSPLFIIIMAGGFTTNLLWCLFLAIKNRTIVDYIKTENTPILKNYIYSATGGIIWYFQFMFYGMGTTKMGELDFASWSIHMSFIIIFSNMWGIKMNEWKGASKKAMRYLYSGLAVLILSTFIIGIGNYMQNYK
jgi:L-rhamnose-H+ transport protein